MARNGNYSDALLRLVKALNETGIRYALTGAAAVGYYGAPRSTMDIDVVVEGKLSDAQIEVLVAGLSRKGFSTSKDEIRRAITGEEVKFQAFDNKTGFKCRYVPGEIFWPCDRSHRRIEGLVQDFRGACG